MYRFSFFLSVYVLRRTTLGILNTFIVYVVPSLKFFDIKYLKTEIKEKTVK